MNITEGIRSPTPTSGEMIKPGLNCTGGLGMVGSLRVEVVREVPRESCVSPERGANLHSDSLK